MDKRTILLNSQFDRKVSIQLVAMSEDKESFAATIPLGRRSPTARRNIKRSVERWCAFYRQLKIDIDTEIETLLSRHSDSID